MSGYTIVPASMSYIRLFMSPFAVLDEWLTGLAAVQSCSTVRVLIGNDEQMAYYHWKIKMEKKNLSKTLTSCDVNGRIEALKAELQLMYSTTRIIRSCFIQAIQHKRWNQNIL